MREIPSKTAYWEKVTNGFVDWDLYQLYDDDENSEFLFHNTKWILLSKRDNKTLEFEFDDVYELKTILSKVFKDWTDYEKSFEDCPLALEDEDD